MQLDTSLFSTDESRSSDTAVALRHPGCPINEICYYLVVGFAKQCPHLEVECAGTKCKCNT